MSRELFTLGWIALLVPALLPAQETGKLQGHIRTDTGEPVAGAQIVIAGSRIGSLSDHSGYYFINHLPAGVHDVQARHIGFHMLTVSQQRVLAGQTHNLDFTLSRAALEIAEIVVLGERNPLVPRDQVASKHIVTGDAVDALPVDNTLALLTVQPGVVAVGERPGSKGFSIRGGRSGEEAVYVDGVLIRNYNEGTTKLALGTNTLAEVDVITGGFSAQFGDAQSGVVNYVTRSGGTRWGGAFSFQTDDLAPRKWSHGFNRAELSLGGKLTGNLGVFLGATATGRRYEDASRYWRSVPIYVQQGVDTTISMEVRDNLGARIGHREVIVPHFVRFSDDGRVPFSGGDEYTVDAKLDYTYGSGSRVFVTGKTSRNQDRLTPRTQIYNLPNLGGALSKSAVVLAGWTHNIVRTPENALSLDVKIARHHDWSLRNNLATDFKRRDAGPPLGFTIDDFQFLINRDDLRVDRRMVENMLRNNVDSIMPFPRRTDLARGQEFRMNPYGIFTDFSTRGIDGGDVTGLHYAEEKQWQLRAVLDWQLNRTHRIKLGSDYFDIDVARLRTFYTQMAGTELWVENPKRASLFVQDRLDLGDLVIEAGLRYDRFDPNSDFPVIPGYYDLDDTTTFERAPVRHAWSPRLGVSFPVTINSTFRLSYGHFTQLPDLNEYYRGKNTDIFRFGLPATVFARPIHLAKTIGYEFGYRQVIASGFVFDLSAYNRSKVSDVTARKLAWPDPTNPGRTTYLNTFTNADFGTIRGVELRLDRRIGVFSGMLGYAYQDARGTGTDPFTAANLAWRLTGNAHVLLGIPENPPQAIWATEEHRKHSLTGHTSVTIPRNHPVSAMRDFSWHVIGRFSSGLAYTRTDRNGELKDGEISSGRMPWQRHVDMKLAKGVTLAGRRTQLVIDARNVFDLENRMRVFPSTDDIREEWQYQANVTAHRATLGAGDLKDVVDLSSTTTAGPGVLNDVDLFLLQRAEQRFGNGDRLFTAAEQERAFRAAEEYLRGPQNLIGPGRRLRFGIEIVF